MDEVGNAFPIDALGGPGTYVCNSSGHLLRVLDAAQCARRFATTTATKDESRTATKISTNPHLTRSKARALAGIFGLRTTF
jgi:hypothetical protein